MADHPSKIQESGLSLAALKMRIKNAMRPVGPKDDKAIGSNTNTKRLLKLTEEAEK